MDLFRAISYIACLIAIIIAVIDSLYPSEKYAKQMKMIFSLVFLSCITAPIVNKEVSLDDISVSVEADSNLLDERAEETYDYFIKSIENNLNMELKSTLTQNQINVQEILTSINISDDNSICIREVQIIMSDKDKYDKAVKLIEDEVGEDVFVCVKECEDEGNNR